MKRGRSLINEYSELNALTPELQEQQPRFDIIGDVHGCVDELISLLGKLGYQVNLRGTGKNRQATCCAPNGRQAVFVGDLVDRGPNSPDVLRLVMAMHAAGLAQCVPGNHDVKFGGWLAGHDVTVTHGLAETAAQMNSEPGPLNAHVADFLGSLDSHLILDDGALVIAHAGISQELIGTKSSREHHFCLYGDTSGERDEFGIPIHYNWAAQYQGSAAIVYGHTPIPEPKWVNNTLCIDTGCVFGGKLTALRWPERDIVQVDALKAYANRIRPFAHPPDKPVET